MGGKTLDDDQKWKKKTGVWKKVNGSATRCTLGDSEEADEKPQ
jgi:hypothetical protein